ncbi:MAG: trigger factor [Phycisphaerales bacterium]|nr:trigger factor [Phycisphaerales bacterium]
MSSSAPAKNQVKVENIGPSRKRVTITIPAEAVTGQLETTMSTLLSEAELPGFRRGRAPRRLIEKKFGGAMKTEARNQLLASAFSEAVQEHKLEVLGDPDGGDDLSKLELVAGKPVTFSLEVEVVPEFKVPKLDGIEVNKPQISVDDKMINDQVDKLCLNEGRLDPQDKAGPGDYCIGRGTMKTEDGVEVLDLDGAVIQIPPADKGPKGAILGIIVDDFAKQVGLPKAGDSLHVHAVGPESHERAEVRGKKLRIDFRVDRVERIVPAAVGELVSKYRLADEAQLRESISLQLNRRVMLEQQAAMHSQIAKYLNDHVEMELPEGLTGKQAERNLQRARLDMMYRGMDAQQVEQRIAELRGSSKEVAARELKLLFILARISQDLKIGLTEEEVGGRIAQMAASRGVRFEQMRDELVRTNQVQMVAQQIREQKTLDALLGKAVVKEIPVEEYNKLVDEQATAGSGKGKKKG